VKLAAVSIAGVVCRRCGEPIEAVAIIFPDSPGELDGVEVGTPITFGSKTAANVIVTCRACLDKLLDATPLALIEDNRTKKKDLN
jgi:hypothetical protein